MVKLDHIDERGKISMIDATQLPALTQEAHASGFIHMKPETIDLIKENEMQQGEVITLAETSGMRAAGMTSQVIPLIHNIPLTRVDVKAYIYPNGIEVKSSVKSICRTGLELEALHAVTAALLTIYEICKSADSSMTVSEVKLLYKSKE
jgi:cyclic pyranopterin phosphate synthase